MRLLPSAIASLLLAGLASAQTATVRYSLDDVWLLPDQSHPGAPPQQMTGHFTWTYTVGDFENGSASFQDASIPWFGSDLNKMVITIDTGSVEFTLNGNYHGLGLDVTLHFLTDLDANTTVALDTSRSSFDVENGISHKGSVISGSVKSEPQLALDQSGPCGMPTWTVSGVPTHGPVALLWARGQGSLVIPNGRPCAGTMLGLDVMTKVGATLTADAAGVASLTTNVAPRACGHIWLQALDLSTCGLSPVILL